MDWDFTRLPETEHQTVKRLYREKAWEALRDIHNHYKLSNYKYCCGGWEIGISNHFGTWIDTKKK